jgi:ATP-dependent DNA helicase 2 subunit 2
MQAIIERYIRSSLNGDLYEKAFECLLELRLACISEDEAPTFNQFLGKLKDLFSFGAHREFF